MQSKYIRISYKQYKQYQSEARKRRVLLCVLLIFVVAASFTVTYTIRERHDIHNNFIISVLQYEALTRSTETLMTAQKGYELLQQDHYLVSQQIHYLKQQIGSLQFQVAFIDVIKSASYLERNNIIANLDDLRIKSNATESQINILLANTPLEDAGWYFLEAERTYGVNAIIMIAIMRQESNLGRAGNLWRYNNFAGITDGRGGWARWDTKREGIFALARLLGLHYLCPNGRWYNGVSIEGVNVRYCLLPDGLTTDWDWSRHIRSHTAQFVYWMER